MDEKKSHPLLRAIKRLTSNSLVNPIVLKAIAPFKDRFSDYFLSKVPVVGRVQFKYDFDCEPFLMFSSGDDPIVSGQYFTGFELPSIKIFVALSKTAETIFDIGANTGVYSIAAAVNNKRARVYAFEPVPRVFERLSYNIHLNDLSNVCAEPVSVSDNDGVQKLYIPEGPIVTTASTAPGFRTPNEIVDVASLTVDTVVERDRLSSVDLLKIDTESTEPFVLRGAIRTIEKMRPAIVCEILRGLTETEIHAIMDRFEYRYFWIHESGLIEKKRIFGDKHYQFRNYLFIGSEKLDLVEKFIVPSNAESV